MVQPKPSPELSQTNPASQPARRTEWPMGCHGDVQESAVPIGGWELYSCIWTRSLSRGPSTEDQGAWMEDGEVGDGEVDMARLARDGIPT